MHLLMSSKIDKTFITHNQCKVQKTQPKIHLELKPTQSMSIKMNLNVHLKDIQ